jgi:TonB family protein
MPDDFRGERGTLLEIDVGPTGQLLSQPKILRSSGNPYYDDNTLRALERTPRLPVPPKPGPIQILLIPEEPG